MGFIKFNDTEQSVQGKVFPSSISGQNVVKLILAETETFTKNLSGFIYYKDAGLRIRLGDYSGYQYLYRESDEMAAQKTIILSDIDKPYVEPVIEEPVITEPVIPEPTLEELIASKLMELEQNRDALISSGADVELSDGSTEHFSFTSDNNSILDNAYTNARDSQMGVPFYNAAGECKVYTFNDIVAIYIAKESLVAYCYSLCHNLSAQVQVATKKANVENVTFTADCLNKTYKEKFEASIAQATLVKDTILEKLEGTA